MKISYLFICSLILFIYLCAVNQVTNFKPIKKMENSTRVPAAKVSEKTMFNKMWSGNTPVIEVPFIFDKSTGFHKIVENKDELHYSLKTFFGILPNEIEQYGTVDPYLPSADLIAKSFQPLTNQKHERN